MIEVILDLLFEKKRKEKANAKANAEVVNWFETNTFPDSLSPYVKEYLRTGQMPAEFYQFSKEYDTIDINRFYDINTHEYRLQEQKKVIESYRKKLIENINNKNYTEYQTKKGKILIVPIVRHGDYVRLLGWGRDNEEYMDDTTIKRCGNLPTAFFAHYGFNCIKGCEQGGSDATWEQREQKKIEEWYFDVVAYINLG